MKMMIILSSEDDTYDDYFFTIVVGVSPSAVMEQLRIIEGIALSNRGTNFHIANTEEETKLLWKCRKVYGCYDDYDDDVDDDYSYDNDDDDSDIIKLNILALILMMMMMMIRNVCGVPCRVIPSAIR